MYQPSPKNARISQNYRVKSLKFKSLSTSFQYLGDLVTCLYETGGLRYSL